MRFYYNVLSVCSCTHSCAHQFGKKVRVKSNAYENKNDKYRNVHKLKYMASGKEYQISTWKSICNSDVCKVIMY